MYSHKLPCLSSLLTIINFYDWLSIKKFVRYSCSSIMIVWRNFCKCRGHTFLNSCKLQIEKKSLEFSSIYPQWDFEGEWKRGGLFFAQSLLCYGTLLFVGTQRKRENLHNTMRSNYKIPIWFSVSAKSAPLLSFFCKEPKLCNPLLTLLFLSSGDSSYK